MVYEKIVSMICEQFGMEPEELSETSTFTEDLGIDSVDVVELVVELEAEFGMSEIPEEDLKKMRTIGDLAEYVRTHADI
ncbi:MAG: acyl carrier protein [Oscillospiraceae bacterium]|nr:acyl carrier protein [Oscillospiraceae bacterium]